MDEKKFIEIVCGRNLRLHDLACEAESMSLSLDEFLYNHDSIRGMNYMAKSMLVRKSLVLIIKELLQENESLIYEIQEYQED